MTNSHPIAELLPGMSPDQERELRLDIKKHGLQVPIVMYEGKILDGRHRARIWFDLHGNRDVPSTAFEGTPAEAIDLVRSLNLKRRHLRTSQIAAFEAAAGAYLTPAKPGRPKKNGGNPPISQRQIATTAGVDRKTIAKAAKVIKNADPIVTMALREGKVSVDRALAISRLPKAKQLDALDGTIKTPKPRRAAQAAVALAVVSERDPLTVAFNRGIEAAAARLEDEGHPALAELVRALKEG